MSSRTWNVRTAKLLADKEAASVLVRLMMAQNDIAMANNGLSEWTFTKDPRRLARQTGGRLYYGRMLMSHVYESLLIIKDPSQSPGTCASLRCTDMLLIRGCGDFPHNGKKLCRIRNNVSFHYDGKLALRALERRCVRHSQTRDGEPGIARDCVKGGVEQDLSNETFSSCLVAPLRHRLLWGGTMSDQLHQAAPSNAGNFSLSTLAGLIDFAGLCGVAFCVGAGAELYLKNPHFWTTDAIAAVEGQPQVVNRSHKGDRLSAMKMDPSTRSAGPEEGFGVLEVEGPLNATITIKDANGRLVFEVDPLRRTTIIAKREARGAPSSIEPGGHIAPKSTVVPVWRPGDCDPSSCRVASLTPG
jgi:hypothetical protein